ncbi:MAG: hypothetical protein A2086_03670 [Spirochaetes bacterium GWD1_27_9]|nr:MAG: hypothetical protein A2086_03670 [Spirochaetes bacterium GWD1_27_9]
MTEQETFYNILIQKTIASLTKNFFEVILVNNKEEAMAHLLNLFDKNSVIGTGGSRTLDEIGFFEKITTKDYPNFLDRKKDLTPEQKSVMQRKALTADFFVSSANGLTKTGELVLLDKWGNRNGAMTYGPIKRVFVIGRNKICPDLQSAIDRTKNKAAVINNIRFDTKTPCTIQGECVDCNSPSRICGVTTIISRCQPPKSILVILVNEDLGF